MKKTFLFILLHFWIFGSLVIAGDPMSYEFLATRVTQLYPDFEISTSNTKTKNKQENPELIVTWHLQKDAERLLLVYVKTVGYFGDIHFLISVKSNQKIYQINVLRSSENRGWKVRSRRYLMQFSNQYLNTENVLAQSIDGISGATVTTQASIRAAEIALQAAYQDFPKTNKPTHD